MADSTPNTPAAQYAWRKEAPLPGKSRRTLLLGVLLALVALVGVGIGLLYWLAPPPTPTLLPIAIGTNPDGGPVAGAEADRVALAGGEVLGKPLDDWAANPHRDQIRLRFRSLAKASHSRPVVVYLAAPASVDDAGGVFLRPADSVGDHPRNRLALTELLAAFKECPSRHRLLVLNLTPPTEDPLFAQPGGDLATAVFRTLEASDDPNRLCIVSCGPGQTPIASPELGRTAFGYFLDAGLHGAADGWSGESRDARVTANELAAYLRAKVREWATSTWGVPQTPVLLGSGGDFTLHAITRSEEPQEPTLATTAFPDWLGAGWTRAEQSRRSPWAFRKARTALLNAERDLLAGAAPADVQKTLEAQLAGAEQLAATLTTNPTPEPLPTLAAVFPGYAVPDATILTELRTAARQLDTRPPAALPAPGDKPAAPEPAVPPEFEPFKAKPPALVALAVFLVLAEDPAPTAARVKGLNQLLTVQNPTPKFAEMVLVRRLAELAATPGFAWSSERASLALQTAHALEDVAARPSVHLAASAALDAVYGLRADAEAVLFAPGFASVEEATQRLRAAASAATRLKEAADRFQNAAAMWEASLEALSGATPLVSAGIADLAAGERLSAATRRLGDSLQPPEKGYDLDAFATRANDLARETDAVRGALTEFLLPVQAPVRAKLRAHAEAGDSGPSLVAELDAILATPLLAVADRAELWNLRASVMQRLATSAVRKDMAERENIRRNLASPPNVNSREVAAPVTDSEATTRRSRWAVALLRAGGADDELVKGVGDELAKLAGRPVNHADRLRRLWAEELPARVAASPTGFTRLLPTTPATAYLDQLGKNPDAVVTTRANLQLWRWQAERFAYEAGEADARDAAYQFAVSAARVCAVAGRHEPAAFLELTATNVPRLTPERSQAELKLDARVVGSVAPPVRFRALTPAEGWVKVTAPAEVSPQPLRTVPLAFGIAAGDNPVSFPEARGVLIEAEAGGRTYHRRAPVSLDDISNLLHLLVRTAPGQPPVAAREVRVRPDGTAQPYQFLLANPTPRDRKVLVRLVGLNREVEVTVPAKKSVPLAFPGPVAAAPAPAAAPPMGQAPLPDLGVLVPGDEVKLELVNPLDREDVLQAVRVPVYVANPADYLRVSDPVFLPAAGKKLNRLSVSVVPGDVPPGGPCNVRLGFPADRNPGLVVRDGSLVGSVTRGGAPVTLYAENLELPGPGETEVWVTVSADGAERVLTYTATLPSLGETVRLTPFGTPLVRVHAAKVSTGTAPLPVTLEVDNAPPGSRLEFVVGTAPSEKEPVKPDLTLPIPTAKDRTARVKFDPKGETFLFTGTLRDHEPKLPVELLVGTRALEARLLSREGKELASHRITVVFDGSAPRRVRFLDLPPKARKDQPLVLRATSDLPLSGIKEVKFFIGKPVDDKVPAAPPPVAGKVFDEKTNEWRAALPVEGQKGTITVGVQFVTNAGLGALVTQDVELVDAAELNKPEPGAIAGKLMEGKLPQPGAVVFLYDDKAVAKAKATTKDDGTFAFKDLVPGNYTLLSDKEATGRRATAPVEVKAGATAKVALELLLK